MKIIIDTRGDIEMEVALKCVENIVLDWENGTIKECIYTFSEPNAGTRQGKRIAVLVKCNKKSTTLTCGYMED